ncbi:MAG: tryptophan synthase subunit alpha [Ignavibacteriae bacterium]|nr:MAG: tryptophan synthase subunit alpha [Ignavibacteriota bacterium]
MSKIKNKIIDLNNKNKKALTVFLTSGFPIPNSFVELVINVAEAGADIIEIGLPFSDSLADGPVIQKSYVQSLSNKIDLVETLKYISQIKNKIDLPIILIAPANLILSYGRDNFCNAASRAGLDGLIIPDIPLEEYEDYFTKSFNIFDKILLTTPTSSEERIKLIDEKSSGFLYYTSVNGTTDTEQSFDEEVLKNLEHTYEIIKNNKMQIGFDFSTPEEIKKFLPFCDGVIVGSAIIKTLETDDEKFTNTINLIKKLKSACNI